MYNQFFTIKPRISKKKRRKQSCTPNIYVDFEWPLETSLPRLFSYRFKRKRKSGLIRVIFIFDSWNWTLHSLMFDGTNVNLSICTNLSTQFKIGEYFTLYFSHPITKEKNFCFLDPCHMLKLVRNTLGDKREL